MKCPMCKIALVLASIGAINWSLVALFNFNLVTAILGDMTTAAKVVYTLVGASGVVLLVSLLKVCPCNKE
jgi:uncharacterized protein